MQEADETLMAHYQQGDTLALETLVRRYADPLLGFLTRMVRDRAGAEDLFQETFLRVHLKSHQFDPSQRFKSWLFAIAAHLAIDAARRRARTPTDSSLSDPTAEWDTRMVDQHPTPSENAEKADRRAQVREAVAALPPRQRATLLLAYFEGLSYPEVAAAMGCTVGTVKTQVSRAIQTLAQSLSPESAP